jgi:hypothetical protein
MPGLQTPTHSTDDQPAASGTPRRWAHTAWNAITGLVGGVVGLAPHVLHHVGLLAGTALVAGSGGTALFGFLGLVASIPLLLRLHRRFRNWQVPALALAVSAALFLLSAFVIGPAISGQDSSPAPAVPSTGHLSHH